MKNRSSEGLESLLKLSQLSSSRDGLPLDMSLDMLEDTLAIKSSVYGELFHRRGTITILKKDSGGKYRKEPLRHEEA